MRAVLVGPTHPWRGGIALHTTELAHRLAAAGHSVRIESWRSQGPARLFPAERGRLAVPEADPFPGTGFPLSWREPAGWWRLGRALAAQSATVLLVVYTPLQAPALWAVGRAARSGARVVAICHNVLPHERRGTDRMLMAALLREVDAAIVHSEEQRRVAAGLGASRTAVACLPPHLPATARRSSRDNTFVALRDEPREGSRDPGRPARRRLLFFGNVRGYKGLDVLLRALSELGETAQDVNLTVAGEFFGGPESTQSLVEALGLASRVELRPGYVPADAIGDLFGAVDALVLPYRSATASQNVMLARELGTPVVATRVGTFPTLVSDGVDGLLCRPGDVADLAAALGRLYSPGMLEQLRAGLRPADGNADWARYVETVERLGAPASPPTRTGTPGVGRQRSRSGPW